MTIQTVNINNIIIEKSRFSLNDFLFEKDSGTDQLEHSFENMGILKPVILYSDMNLQLHLIDGRKRIYHAEKNQMASIHAIILPESTPIPDIVILIFTDRRIEIEQSIINKIEFISFAMTSGAEETWILKSLCMPLQLKPHKEFLRECERIHALPQELKAFCHEKKFSLKQILNLTLYPYDLLSQIISWKYKVHFSASILEEIASNLKDYLRSQKKTIHDFVSEPEVHELIHSDVNPRERTEKLRQFIHLKRYPILSEINAKIEKTVENLNLPKEIAVFWDRTLENKRVDIRVTLKDPEEWPQVLEKLKSLDIESALAKILEEL